MKTLSKITIPIDQALTTYRDFVVDEIIKDYAKGDNVEIIKDMSKVQPTFSDLIALVLAGCKFENIVLAIEFASGGAANQDVPAILPGSVQVDEDGVEQPRTWIEWFKVNTSSRIITNGTVYVAKASFNGKLLNSDELAAVHAQSGVRVIEWDDAVSRFQDESYSEYELP